MRGILRHVGHAPFHVMAVTLVLALFPGSPLPVHEVKKNMEGGGGGGGGGGGEPGTLPHLVMWHIDVTAIMTLSQL